MPLGVIGILICSWYGASKDEPIGMGAISACAAPEMARKKAVKAAILQRWWLI